MGGLYEYFLAAVVFILLAYGLVRQVQRTLTIQKINKSKVYNYKRALIGSYVTSISFLVFSISLMLNITNTLSQNYTVIISFVFLTILFIAKFSVTPKQQDPLISR